MHAGVMRGKKTGGRKTRGHKANKREDKKGKGHRKKANTDAGRERRAKRWKNNGKGEKGEAVWRKRDTIRKSTARAGKERGA